ncbi:MAG TPA: hypothetical protein PK765_07595 [bacterium]|nr:hypothetical protein [bacterium]
MKTVKSLLCTILATIFLATQSILPISAAESSAPSLGAISFKNEKLESVYTKVDKALDRAIGRVEAKLTSRERWALKQSLATIRSRFIGIDQAMSERDREGFKSEVKIFKTQYTTVITFLKNVESREEVRTSKPTLASTESVGTGQVALPKAQAQYLSREAFANLGVRLDASIASSYLR